MNITKALVIAAAAAAFVAVAPQAFSQDQTKDKPAAPAATPAQGRQGRGQQAGQGAGLQAIIAQLDLTDDQKAQIKPILEDLRQAMQDARNLQPPARGQKLRQAMQDARQKINPILTEEQRTKLQTLMQQARGATTQPTNPAARLQAALQDLNLTDDQKAKVKDIVDKYRPQFEEILKNANGDRQSAMQQIRPLMTEMRDKIVALLTPEQAEKFRNSLGAGAGGRGGAGGAGRNGARQRQQTGNGNV